MKFLKYVFWELFVFGLILGLFFGWAGTTVYYKAKSNGTSADISGGFEPKPN